MAQITLNIPNDRLAEAVDLLSEFFGYVEVTDDNGNVVNTETRQQFVVRKIKESVASWMATTARRRTQQQLTVDSPPVT